MRRCQNCSYENPDAMNFCMQCGAALSGAPQSTGNMRTNADTQPFQLETPTVASNQQKTFAVNQPNFNPNPNMPPTPPPSKGNGKWFLIIGGILVLLVLGGIGIVAIVGVGILSSMNNVKVTPTPTPRTIDIKTPTPIPTTAPNTSPTVKSATAPNGKYDSMKVDFDVTEGGKKGMRILVNFSTFNLKATDCYMAVYFQDENGVKLKSTAQGFSSEQGNLALFVLLRPNYDETVYKELKAFMPYEEIKVPTGTNKLKLDVDLIDKPGNLIQHLNLYEFTYEKY